MTDMVEVVARAMTEAFMRTDRYSDDQYGVTCVFLDGHFDMTEIARAVLEAINQAMREQNDKSVLRD